MREYGKSEVWQQEYARGNSMDLIHRLIDAVLFGIDRKKAWTGVHALDDERNT